MSKQGMKRPEITENEPKNAVPPVPQIHGKARSGKAKAKPIIAGTSSPAIKVYHSEPFSAEKPIPDVYSAIDSDLARDNIENDIPAADLEDL